MREIHAFLCAGRTVGRTEVYYSLKFREKYLQRESAQKIFFQGCHLGLPEICHFWHFGPFLSHFVTASPPRPQEIFKKFQKEVVKEG